MNLYMYMYIYRDIDANSEIVDWGAGSNRDLFCMVSTKAV